MDSEQLNNEKIQAIKDLALQAGKAVMQIYNSSQTKVKVKKDSSPVTQADIKANEIIVQGLKKLFPAHAVLTEEEADDKTRLEKEYTWIIDPLDGTKEFISKNGEFTINIALAKKGEPILGAIYAPAKDELYYAQKGQGAYFEKECKSQKITVSKNRQLIEMTLIKSRSHASPKLSKLIEEQKIKNIKTSGSSLKGCKIAQAKADIYYRFGTTCEWDICAMHAILNEAGGKITDLNGNKITYNKENVKINGFIASNNTLHDNLVKLAQNIFLVDFIGIGVGKSGTSWLARMLEQHPQICFSRKKECDYFNKRGRTGKINTRFNLGLDFYRSFWPKKINPSVKIGEFSTNYLYDDHAPKLIKNTFPNAKLLVMLRNPIQRTYSDYLSRVNGLTLPENLSFEEALEKYDWLIKGSEYTPQLKKYFNLFPKEQIKIFLLDEVKNNPSKVAEELYRFIGVDPTFQPTLSPVHTASKVRNKTLARLHNFTFITVPRKILLSNILPKTIITKVLSSKTAKIYESAIGKISKLNFKKAIKPEIKKETKEKLLQRFDSDITQLEKLLNKNLSMWKK